MFHLIRQEMPIYSHLIFSCWWRHHQSKPPSHLVTVYHWFGKPPSLLSPVTSFLNGPLGGRSRERYGRLRLIIGSSVWRRETGFVSPGSRNKKLIILTRIGLNLIIDLYISISGINHAMLFPLNPWRKITFTFFYKNFEYPGSPPELSQFLLY
jgi:hypothetical protein